MAEINEIAPGVYRISTFVSEFHIGFNQFLVRGDEPLLFHTGLNAIRDQNGRDQGVAHPKADLPRSAAAYPANESEKRTYVNVSGMWES